eukprot:13462967-Alexandrium_andersonii.AAC.1
MVRSAPTAPGVQHVPKEDARDSLGTELGLVPDVGERWHETRPSTEWGHAMLPICPEPTLPRAIAVSHSR